MEQENERKEAQNTEDGSTEAKVSGHKTPKSLKAKSKIAKKLPVNDLNSKRTGSAKKQRIRKKKNKTVSDGQRGSSNAVQENSKELKLKEVNKKQDVSKKEETKESQEQTGRSDRDQWKQRNEDTSLRTQKKNESDKNEKLGGLIFMCSKKTKPDCFHYQVMGVSTSKKDLVLGIKPGLKLFLYDFDLKLLYGIYKASSSGGMKLEPKAFGGAFPVQVRFNIQMDCYPLPESVFKTAIKENYNEKQKFKIELTTKQVKKLSKLFRPASLHSTTLPKIQDREVYVRGRESNRDPYANGSSRSYRRSSREREVRLSRERELPRERDHRYSHKKVRSPHREENRRDLYLSEKEYRTYGLRGERSNLTSTRHITPLEPYQMSHERGHQLHEREHQLPLRHLEPAYRDSALIPREPVPADRHYLTERNYQTYNIGARHEVRSAVSPVPASIAAAASTSDPYIRDRYSTHYTYDTSTVDPYLPPRRREEVALSSYSMGGTRDSYRADTDYLRRRDIDPVDRLYTSYASSALSDYNQQAAAPPVSSRYSFAGPSLSFR